MKLAQYLSETKTTHAEFASRIGATQAAVTRYANGKRVPRPLQLARITVATGGKVTANDFFEAEPPPPPPLRPSSLGAAAAEVA